MPFIVKIETGNEAMSDGRDVAAVLREVAKRLERGGGPQCQLAANIGSAPPRS